MSPFFRRLSIRQKLLGAFSVDLVLMMLLGAFALVQMGVVREKADEVALRTLPALRNVDRLQKLMGEYRRLQLEMVLFSNQADRERTARALGETEERIASRLAEHPRHLDGTPQIEAFRAFETAWQEYIGATHDRFLPAVARGTSGTVQPALSRLNPLHRRLVAAADRLENLGAAAAEDAMGVLQNTHRRSRRFILVDTAFSLTVSMAVGLALAAGLARRIRHLTSATRRVAQGDLHSRLPQSGREPEGDELGKLAEHFEIMVESLRRQRDSLEQRHRELAESLDRQRRLTEDLVRGKQAEEAADRARVEAEARDSAKSLFLATMSHELRTPLNAVLGYVQIMTLEARAEGRSQALKDLGRAQAAGRHLATLINNLLDFSKIDQDEIEVEVCSFQLADLVQEVVAITEPLISERGNCLHWQPNPRLGAMDSDPVKIRQILFNLLSNAAKFTAEGEVTLEVERLENAATDSFRFAVRDTGIGIAAEHLELIFQPFRQADNSIGRRFGGTGLGLVISRRLSRLLGGDISVLSTPGEGSLFTVVLPARAPSTDSTTSAAVPGPLVAMA